MVVDRWRERTCTHKPSAGVPAHVTLLFPFVPATEISHGLLDEVSKIIRASRPFEFELSATGRFATALYLAPTPATHFTALTQALATRFPAYPPYGGAFDGIVPHLTVAEGTPATLDAAREEIAPILPLSRRCDGAVLLEELSADPPRWRVATTWPMSDSP